MGFDLRFKSAEAAEKGFPVVEGEVRVEMDDEGNLVEYRLADGQVVGGWQGTVCPSGHTMVRDKPSVRAALLAAGVSFEEC
jgi:uncharacterized cupin superfamily protein